MEWAKRAWHGDERLWKVFWVYGVLAGFGFGIADLVIKAIGFGSIVGIAYIVFRIVYTIWLMVAEWRCAFNADWAFWGYLIRTLIVLSILGIFVGLAAGFGFIGSDLMKAAQCRRDLKTYVAHGGTDAEDFKKKCIEEKARQGIANGAPAMPPVVQAPPKTAEESKQLCIKDMTQFAQDRGADPQNYIAQNQKYLQECTQYHLQNGATK